MSQAVPPRVLILFVTYGDTYPGARGRLIALVDSWQLPKRLVVIRNDRCDLPARQVGAWQYEIGGDNSVFEFSGWQRAAMSEPALTFDADVLVLVNSSFVTHRFHSLPAIDTDILRALVRVGGIAGCVRRLGYPARWNGLDLSEWVITHWFAMTPAVMGSLRTLVTEANPDRFLSATYRPDCLSRDPIWAGPMRDYLWTGLTRKYRGQGRRFTRENYPFFRRKILTIINEIALTARVREQGFPIHDISPFPTFLNSAKVIRAGGTELRPYQFLRRVLLDFAAEISKRTSGTSAPGCHPDPLTRRSLARARQLLEPGQSDD